MLTQDRRPDRRIEPESPQLAEAVTGLATAYSDMDAAIAVVKTWPMLDLPGVAVEIRPMVEDYTQFE